MFTLSIAVHTGGLAENDFWLVHVRGDAKKTENRRTTKLFLKHVS